MKHPNSLDVTRTTSSKLYAQSPVGNKESETDHRLLSHTTKSCRLIITCRVVRARRVSRRDQKGTERPVGREFCAAHRNMRRRGFTC